MVGARVPRARRRCEMKSGWVTKKLGEVCEINYGTRVRRKDSRSDNYPVYGGGGETFRWEIFNRENQCVVSRFAMSPECVRFVSGKFFLNDSGLTVDAASDGLLQDYLDWCLFGKQDIIYALGKGSAQKNLDIREFVNIPIPIPPLAEQKRIVAKIDAAFEKIDKLKADAEKNLANAKELFQSALDEAMRPKDGWVEKRLGEVYDVRDGTHDSPRYVNEGWPLITSKNLRDGAIVFDGVKYISKNDYDAINVRSRVDVGDVLMAMIGTIGNPVVVIKSPSYAIKNMALFKLQEGQCSQFLRYLLMSPDVTLKMEREFKGSTQHFVSLKYLRNFKAHFPPLSEQREIVKRLDLLAEKIKILEQNYTQQIADCVEMRQAVLREAFEGRL